MLRGLHRVDGALLAPTAPEHDLKLGRQGSFDAQLQVLDSFRNAKRGLYGIVATAEDLQSFFVPNGLHLTYPLSLRFSAHGSAIVELRKPSGKARAAWTQLLPPCLLELAQQHPQPDLWHGSSAPERNGLGLDRYGALQLCPKWPDCRLGESCYGLPYGGGKNGIEAVR